MEYNISKKLCDNYNILNSNNIYLKRGDTIRCVFRILGVDDTLLRGCSEGYDIECLNILDLTDYPNPDEVYYYVIGEESNTAYTRVNIFNNVYLKYDSIMTVKEAIVLLQSCIQDIEHFTPQYATKDDIKLFYKNAKKSGIITKKDLIYWIPINVPLSKSNMYILINRFLQQHRYKYIREENVKYPEDRYYHKDEDKTMTYLEYLNEIYK